MSLCPSGALKNAGTADWQGEDVGFSEACKPTETKRHAENKNSIARLTGANVRRRKDNSKLLLLTGVAVEKLLPTKIAKMKLL
jgi:hypothetical protein